ncbi:hypothetical protein J2T60_001372 [Natronospira proteinivora]|uniref:Uncharacterized protein n=1 Tax=Natronospira proteinivora TaxID=1807133 RepID=A0ABT1G8N0_9GAMM|nr:hypothetical protein [Natronospira proteinivora]MCP1727407.1 hypothetical protein [Natronospira proteinivora]
MSDESIETEQGKPDRGRFSFFSRSEIPLAVYLAIFFTMTLLWFIQEVHEELTLGLFTELLGAAFTLFIIDTLLVRAKDKRWRVVRAHVDYLIRRNVNRLRDGVTTRVFHFNPDPAAGASTHERVERARSERGRFLDRMATLEGDDLLAELQENSLFTDNAYSWFNDKANDLWEIINMKYSEYMDPDLVSALIQLHTRLKDVCSHIRQYQKGERFSDSRDHYRQAGRLGVVVSLNEIIQALNSLKRQGYSESASLGEQVGSDAEAGLDEA